MFAYCLNNFVNYSDDSGNTPVSFTSDYSTRKISENEDQTVYVTTITFTNYIAPNPASNYPMPPISTEYTVSLEFAVTNSGIVIFDNMQSSASKILDSGVANILVSEMIRSAKSQVPGSLEGRTLSGLKFELTTHYYGYQSGIRTDNTDVTHMGSNVKGSIGHDYNADWFEHPIRNLKTIYEAVSQK